MRRKTILQAYAILLIAEPFGSGREDNPKQWKAEIQSLQAEYDSIGKEQSKTATELAYAEIISYNRKNLERELQNENRQHK